MGAVKARTWKDLVEQAEIAKKSANKLDPPTLKPKWVPSNKNCDTTLSSQSKGKDTLAVEVTEQKLIPSGKRRSYISHSRIYKLIFLEL